MIDVKDEGKDKVMERAAKAFGKAVLTIEERMYAIDEQQKVNVRFGINDLDENTMEHLRALKYAYRILDEALQDVD